MWIAKSQNENGARLFESTKDFLFSEIDFESFKKIRHENKTCNALQTEFSLKNVNRKINAIKNPSHNSIHLKESEKLKKSKSFLPKSSRA